VKEEDRERKRDEGGWIRGLSQEHGVSLGEEKRVIFVCRG